MKAPQLTEKRARKRDQRKEWALQVKARDHYCRYTMPEWGGFYCRLRATDAHHVLARSQGGADDLSNGLGLCRDHHMWAHDNPKLASMHGVSAHVGDCSELPETVGASDREAR